MLKTKRPNTFSLRNQRALLSACLCSALCSPFVWATPQGDHEAEADVGSENGKVTDNGSNGAIAIGTTYDTRAFAIESLDGINGGVYRYFGYQAADVDAGSEGVFSIASNAGTTISGLNSNDNYVVAYTHTAIADGPDFNTGVAQFSISTNVNSGVWSKSVDKFGENESGTMPVVISGISSITFSVDTYVVDFGSATASSAISIFELTTNSLMHNDSDVNDDGVTDAFDIDTLNNVLNAGVAGAGANPNLIAMFDVNSDSSVDSSDRDALIMGTGGLDTSYGDVNLDGVVDDLDYAVIVSNDGDTGGWAEGDVTGDFQIDMTDLAIWDSNNEIVLGDMNVDGVLSNGDSAPFVQALTDRAAWEAMYPGRDADLRGDFTGDGLLTNADIAHFTAALSGGTSVPEPGSFLLLLTGTLLLAKTRPARDHL